MESTGDFAMTGLFYMEVANILVMCLKLYGWIWKNLKMCFLLCLWNVYVHGHSYA